MNTAQLFIQRRQSSWQHAVRIVRVLAGGGGTPFILGILLSVLYYGYQRGLAWLPANFPVAALLALILSFFLTSSRLRTWIQPPDLFFLLPLEAQMGAYFRASLRYSWLIHLIHLGWIWLLFYPLYRIRCGETGDFILTGVGLALCQWVNVYSHWLEIRRTSFSSTSSLRKFILIRWGLNLGISFLLLQQNGWLLGMVAALFLGLIWYLEQTTPPFPYPWILLRDQEQQTLARYYAIAREFVDLPEVVTPIKPRMWLIRWMERLLPQQQALSYLYWRSFFRSSELFSIYIRILVWAGCIIALFPNIWVFASILCLSSWMFGTQLPSLANPHHYPVWLQLYPLSQPERNRSLTQMNVILLGLQISLLTLIFFMLQWVNR
jgi:ABC-2 type transport system permease protein